MLRCSQTKAEIVQAIYDEFERVKTDLDNSVGGTKLYDMNYGRYQAMMDLLQKVIIYEE